MSSFKYLLDRFDAIGVYEPGMSITFDPTFTGSAELSYIFERCFGQTKIDVVVQSWDRSEQNDHLRLTGTADILNIEKAELRIFATDLNAELHFIMEITIPGGWKFSTSFPDLPPALNDTSSKDNDVVLPSVLNDLSMGASKLVLTNQYCRSETLKADLVPGLNFSGELYFMGLLFGLSTLTGEDGPIQLSGPVIEYRTKPDPIDFLGIRLKAPVALKFNDFPMAVRNTRVYVKCPLNTMQMDHSIDFMRIPGVYFFADVDFAGRTADMIGRYNEKYGSIFFSLYGRMTDFPLSGFSSLTSHVGGDDLGSALPAKLQTPSGLKLTELGIGFNVSKRSVSYFMLALGIDTHWTLIEDVLSLEEIGIRFMIDSPFDNKARNIRVSLSAALNLKGTMLGVFAEAPTYAFGGGLLPGQNLPLGDLIESFSTSVPNLPEMTVSELLFYASPQEKTFAFDCEISDLISAPVGSTFFELASIEFAMRYEKATGVTGAFTAEMNIAEATAILAGELTDRFTLTGSLQRFDLKKFWSLVTGGEALPEEIPDIVFENLTLTVAPKEGDFTLLGSAKVDWDKLPFEGSVSTHIEFSLAVDKTKSTGTRTTAINANLTLQGTGPATFGDGFSMERFNFLFEYQTKIGWKLSGGTTVKIFDTELHLQAGYATSPAGNIFTLTTIAKPEIKLISLDGVGAYSFRQLDLKIERKQLADKKVQTFWNLRVDSTLKINQVMTVGGYLNLFDDAGGRKGLVFNPTPGTATAAIDLPGGEGAGMDVTLFEMGFLKETAAGSWAFSGTVDIKFKGAPGWMGHMLPSALHGKLVAGAREARISAVKVSDPVKIKLPDVDGKPMGTVVVQLTEVGINLRPGVGLMLETGLGFSEELNNFLGGGQILRVYNEGDILSLARTRLSIASSGIEAQFLSSPFMGVNAVSIAGESWFDVDFGQYGAMRLKMPTFKYDGITQYFEAGGGAEITKPLAIPLSPIKMLLKGAKLDAAAKAVPDKLPIKSVDIVDDHGDFKIDALIALLEHGGKMPGEIKQLLRSTANLLDRFPDTFKQYFNIEVPEKIEFKFGFSPTGRISFTLIADKTPIRILQPALVQGVIPMPGLHGIEIRKIVLGTLASGSLFQLTIDGHMDTYDFGTLALSLALPEDESFPLPTSDQLQRRLILDNVFMVIPVSAGVPIPIPLFYDRIGLEYMGIEGVGLQAHLGFPAPELSGMAEFFTTLKQFFSDRDYLLDPSTPPGIDLKFNLGNNYLQLPEYLGSKVLGMKDKPKSTGAWFGIAHALNFMKTISLNELIQSIPIEDRVGSANHSFAFLHFDADWLITTPQEFKDGAFHHLQLSTGDRDDFMAVLPAVVGDHPPATTKPEEGLVVFLRGEVDVAVVGLEVVFGLAASGSMGFNTGFKMTGTIADFMELELGGRIGVNPNAMKTGTGSVVALSGHTHLDFGSHRAFEGDIRLSENRFQFKGHLDLFPKSLPFSATGTLEGWVSSDGFYMAGDVQTALAGLTLMGARAILSNKQVLIEGTWLGVTTTLEVWQEADALSLKGAVALNLWGFKAHASIYINSEHGAVVQGDVDGINLEGLFKLTGAAGKPKASFLMDFTSGHSPIIDISGAVVLLGLSSETQVRVGDDGFDFKTSGKMFNLFNVTLEVSGKQLNRSAGFSITATLQNDLFAYLKDQVSKAIKAAADEATASITHAQNELDKARKDVNHLNDQINRRRQEIEQGRAAAKNKLSSAQGAVTKAQNSVNSLNRQIKSKEAERDRQSKKQACTSIRYWKPTPTWSNPLKGHWAHKRACVPDPGGIAKAAKLQTEITGLYVALGTATAGLETAKGALKVAKGAIDVTPIEADPQLAGLYTAKETATVGLTAAKGILEGAKETVGAVASVGDFITKYGLGGLLDVRSATFQAGLSAAAGGEVALDMQLDFMGESQRLDFKFNFNDPLAGAKSLAKKLLPG